MLLFLNYEISNWLLGGCDVKRVPGLSAFRSFSSL